MTAKQQLKEKLNSILLKAHLCAKWTDRKGLTAIELRKFMDLSPKQYRQLLVEFTANPGIDVCVPEIFMCANKWNEINFSKVPSVCHARNKKAFNRHTETYAEYVEALKRGDADVKINSGAVFPYDVLKGLSKASMFDDYTAPRLDAVEREVIIQQWNALENFIGSGSILPLVDVSGSMICSAGNNSKLSALDVAISLGLYCADKNEGAFNSTFLTFSAWPELVHLKGNIIEKYEQMCQSEWMMNTNLHRVMAKILTVASENSVPQNEMPDMLLILSDMAFDHCVEHDDTAMEMITRKYIEAGYAVPKIVFWNLHAYSNVPVKFDESGVALVSGFSPAILRSLLNNDLDQFTPEAIMETTIQNPRYDL